MSELLIGCLAGVRSSEAQLLIEAFAGGEAVAPLIARLRLHRVDGVLLPALLCDDAALVGALVAAGFAVVRVAATCAMAGAAAVGIDDEGAAFAITDHLVRLGHRRVGCIAGPADHTVSALRLAGYRRALAGAGIGFDSEAVVAGAFTYRSGLVAAEALLRLPGRPTAIFACNDDMAAAAIAVAHRCHLDVPADLSVCGFDDSAMARTIWPEISTIRQPAAAMAERAALLLVEQVRARRRGGQAEFPQLRLDFELVKRGSEGPPRG